MRICSVRYRRLGHDIDMVYARSAVFDGEGRQLDAFAAMFEFVAVGWIATD
jgi:hypothetical protein